MDVNAVKTVETNLEYPGNKNSGKNQVSQKVGKETEIPKFQTNKSDRTKADKTKDSFESKDSLESKDRLKGKDSLELSEEDIEMVNEALNSFMKAIHSDLHFIVHEGTDVVMLQVVDRRDNSVIKEIPSSELLDVLARIRESVGALLDEKV